MDIKPYGDTTGDGAVQLSFTLPVKMAEKAVEAARLFVVKLGFDSCEIVHSEPLSGGHTFFIAYGKTGISVDYDKIEAGSGLMPECMKFDEINAFIEENIKRRVVVVGACTGSDAHTVSLDAIMNMKGYNHHYGLERYPMIESHNLGAQVPNEELIEFAKRVKADAILVSQVVTQKDMHIRNLTGFIELVKKHGCRDHFILLTGGPRITGKLGLSLGFDAGFGRGTYAEHVATFIVKRVAERRKTAADELLPMQTKQMRNK